MIPSAFAKSVEGLTSGMGISLKRSSSLPSSSSRAGWTVDAWGGWGSGLGARRGAVLGAMRRGEDMSLDV